MDRRATYKLWWVAGAVLAGLWIPDFAMADESAQALYAGAYAQDITPTRWPISVNGGMSDHLATAAHDPLHARCLVLKNQKLTLAIAICDSCVIPRKLMDQAKAKVAATTGISASNILISATHAHSCPTVASLFQSEPDQDYAEFLVQQIAAGIDRAHRQLEPAKVGWGSVNQPSLLFNRRWLIKGADVSQDSDKQSEPAQNPFGDKTDRVITNPGYSNPQVSKPNDSIDPQFSFLSVQSLSGRPIALLANYSLHYVGGVPGDLVSADYFGEFATRLTGKLNAAGVQPPFVGMMSNGTSGDINNVDFRQKSAPQRAPFEQIAYVAELLSQDIQRVYDKTPHHTSLPLEMHETEIEVGIRKPTSDEISAAERKLAASDQKPLRDRDLIYARETTLLGKYDSSARIKLQAIRIGSLAIATSPCETFVETGLAIKKSSPLKSTFTISLANGYNGYLPPPDQMQLGGYETWRARSSCLTSDSEPKILSSINQLLKKLGN